MADYRAGRFERAEAGCRLVLSHRPREPGANQLLALVLLRSGEVRAAREHIGGSLAERPDRPPSLAIAASHTWSPMPLIAQPLAKPIPPTLMIAPPR